MSKEMTPEEFLKEKGIHPTEPIYWDLKTTSISLNELLQEYANVNKPNKEELKNFLKFINEMDAFKKGYYMNSPDECVQLFEWHNQNIEK